METGTHAAASSIGAPARDPRPGGRARTLLDRLLQRSEVYQFFAGSRRVETAPIELGHRRVFILPTAHGVIFGLSILLMLIGSANYSLGLGFALAFLLAGISVAGLIHTFRNLVGLAVSPGRSEPVFAGEQARFVLHIENRAGHARTSLAASAAGGTAKFDIPPRDWAHPEIFVPTDRRGWLPLGRVTIETRYPLGLFRTWSHARPEARVLVYPRPELRPLPGETPHAASGGIHEHGAGSDDYAGLRTYQAGDSPRHIAWKAVARSDQLVTKQFTDPGARELVFDWRLLPPRSAVEERLSILTGWVVQAERTGERYALSLPGTLVPPGRGQDHATECLRALALFDPGTPAGVPPR